MRRKMDRKQVLAVRSISHGHGEDSVIKSNYVESATTSLHKVSVCDTDRKALRVEHRKQLEGSIATVCGDENKE